MKVIVNSYIPLGDFVAVNVCGLVFAKRPLKAREILHEEIHTKQIKELLAIGFYALYLLEFVVKLFLYLSWSKAYYNLSFEREAYKHEYFRHYLHRRKPYAWYKYLLAR